MAGETNVGAIYGTLRLDASQWNATLAEAGVAAERLGQSDPNIDVHANTGGALAALAAVQGESDHLNGQHPTVHPDVDNSSFDRGIRESRQGMGALVTAALTLGPALVPVTGAVAGLGLAFGGLGAAGALAFLGIKDAIKNGSEAGEKFQGGLDTLKGNLDLLAATAAGGVLTPFLGIVDDLQDKMPALQNGIGVLSGELGQVMRPAADGITTAFIKLLPLMTDLADYAIRGAEAFDRWAHGDGLQRFGGYAMAVLPQVLDTLGQLIQLAGNVAAAFSGWGSMVLGTLGMLASVLNSMPQGVLTVLATGGLAVYTAFKGFGLLQSLVSGFGSAIGGLAANMSRLGATQAATRLQGVAGALRSVGTAGSIASIAVGGIAAVLGIATFAWSIYKQKQQEAKAAQEAMTQAIQEDSGALGENARKVIAKTIADGDLISRAKDYGLTQQEVVAAVTQGGDAMTNLTDRIKQNGMATGAASGAMGGMGKSQKVLSDGAKKLIGDFETLNGRIGKGKKEFDANKLAAAALGEGYDGATQSLSSLELSQLNAADATKEQKKAIDQLNQSLDGEISRQLQLQGGLTGEAAARRSMLDVLKKQKSSTNLNTDAGIKQRQAIEQAVGQVQSYRDTMSKAGATTAETTATYKSQGLALLESIKHTDGANSATYKYAQQLLKMPKDVETKVGTTGTEVSVSQLKGVTKEAKALGVTRINVPVGTPNAKNVASLLNNVSEAALSADKKSVNIKTATPHALVDKLRLEGITGAAVAADGKSVNVPTRTLNQPRTVAEIEEVLNKTKDKSMTVTARENRLGHVIGQLDYIAGHAVSRSFTVSAYYVTTAVTKHVDERLARGRGYATGTTNATEGIHPVAERGMELVIGPQSKYLAAGSVVLNHQDTMRTLAGDRGPIMRATGGSTASSGSDPELKSLLRHAIATMERTAVASAGAAAAVPAALAAGRKRIDMEDAQHGHVMRKMGGGLR